MRLPNRGPGENITELKKATEWISCAGAQHILNVLIGAVPEYTSSRARRRSSLLNSLA